MIYGSNRYVYRLFIFNWNAWCQTTVNLFYTFVHGQIIWSEVLLQNITGRITSIWYFILCLWSQFSCNGNSFFFFYLVIFIFAWYWIVLCNFKPRVRVFLSLYFYVYVLLLLFLTSSFEHIFISGFPIQYKNLHIDAWFLIFLSNSNIHISLKRNSFLIIENCLFSLIWFHLMLILNKPL